MSLRWYEMIFVGFLFLIGFCIGILFDVVMVPLSICVGIPVLIGVMFWERNKRHRRAD